MSKKRFEAEKNLAKNLEERKLLEVENAHKNEKVLFAHLFFMHKCLNFSIKMLLFF
jgi:hypothetical protein